MFLGGSGLKLWFCSRLGSTFLVMVLTIVAGACGTTKISDIRDFDTQFLEGKYHDSAIFASQKFNQQEAKNAKKDKNDQKKGMLWALESGAAYRMAGQFDNSTAVFQRAEDMIKTHDLRLATGKAAGQVGAVLLNDRTRAYQGQEYDGIMVNTYQALNAMEMQRWGVARVQMNRAYIRQQHAVERFQKKIKKEQAAIEEEKKKSGDAAKASSNSEVQKCLNKEFPEIGRWKAYPDFVNPFTSYLYGLYFFAAGEGASDLEKATSSLKRVVGMVPGQSNLEADLLLFEDVASGRVTKAELPSQVWVVFENGMGPLLEESRIDWPIPYKGKPLLISFALPRLRERSGTYSHLVVRSEGTELGKTQQVGSMERVVQTEFRKNLPGIWTRALLGAATKTILQNEAGKELGPLGALAGMIFQAATTKADLRIWTILPKDFQVVRVERPTNGHLLITAPSGATVADVMVPDTRFSMVYVKMPTQSLPPLVSIIPFPEV